LVVNLIEYLHFYYSFIGNNIKWILSDQL